MGPLAAGEGTAGHNAGISWFGPKPRRLDTARFDACSPETCCAASTGGALAPGMVKRGRGSISAGQHGGRADGPAAPGRGDQARSPR